jgi:hypothetical protein
MARGAHELESGSDTAGRLHEYKRRRVRVEQSLTP